MAVVGCRPELLGQLKRKLSWIGYAGIGVAPNAFFSASAACAPISLAQLDSDAADHLTDRCLIEGYAWRRIGSHLGTCRRWRGQKTRSFHCRRFIRKTPP